MAKGKSSASSATRKKHARKAAVAHGVVEEPQTPKEKKPKGKEKGKKNKEPRKKVYIPPVKPAPVQPDPLDTFGIAQRIPAELLVVLRRLAKKDSITKRRALEDLQANWVEKAKLEGTEGDVARALAEAVPVWFHHVASLFLHPSRRIRLLAVGLHLTLLGLSGPILEQLLYFLREIADADQIEYILGTWCAAAHDVDRQVQSLARGSWEKYIDVLVDRNDDVISQSPSRDKIVVDAALFFRLQEFAMRIILDPGGVYLYVNPPQPSAPPPPSRKGGVKGPTLKEEDFSSRGGRSEEDEESDTDRKARLRISGLGVLEWLLDVRGMRKEESKITEEFLAPLENFAIWTALYHTQYAPFMQDQFEAFGYNQAGVRKAAWALLSCLLRNFKVESLAPLLPVISVAALRSAWVETDLAVRNALWQPLLTLLRDCKPNPWDMEASFNLEYEEVEDESADEQDNVETDHEKSQAANKVTNSRAYEEFRQFLELGCLGSPVQSYPAVVVVLSTITPSIFASVATPVSTFFASFWAAIDGRALSGLDRNEASAAFLSSLLDCIIYLSRQLVSEQGVSYLGDSSKHLLDPRQEACELLRDQFGRIWEELSQQRLKLKESAAANLLAKALVYFDQLGEEIFQAAWGSLASVIRAHIRVADHTISPLVPALLKDLQKASPEGSFISQANAELTTELVHIAIIQIENVLQSDISEVPHTTHLASLVSLLDVFSEVVFADKSIASAIDEALLAHTTQALTMSPAILFVYLSHRNDKTQCERLWCSVLESIGSYSGDIHIPLTPLLEAAERGALPAYLKPGKYELGDTVGHILVRALSGLDEGKSLAVLKRIFQASEYFISHESLMSLVSQVVVAFSLHLQDVMSGKDVPVSGFDALLTLLDSASHKGVLQKIPSRDILCLMRNIFLLAYVLPLIEGTEQLGQTDVALGKQLWKDIMSQVTEDVKEGISATVKQYLRDTITDCSSRLSPSQLLSLLTDESTGLSMNPIHDIFPSQNKLNEMLLQLPSDPLHVSLAVIDTLVLPSGSDGSEKLTAKYDASGYSSYARAVTALLYYFLFERSVVRENTWALHHFIALSLYAQDTLNVPFKQGVVLSRKCSRPGPEDLIAKAQQIIAYILSPTSDDSWLAKAATAISSGKIDGVDGVTREINALIHGSNDTMRESRILHVILQHALSNATKEEADQLLLISRNIQRKAPHIALAITFSVTQYAPEPPRLDRFRNELAADILGVKPSKANTEGLWLLRRLVAVAPDPDSDIIYLPTPRAVNLMKSLEQWTKSDEELDEEVESEMTTLFFHLAPILQNVSGSHWDLIFDMVENNLENCSFNDASTWPVLGRTLKLYIAIQDLTSTNKALRAVWGEKSTANLTLIRDLVAQKLESDVTSAPLSVCRELALSILQDLPASLMDEDTLSKMCHLVHDASENVEIMAYKMLRSAAAKRTEYLVVEAATDSETATELDLPTELVALLETVLDEEAEQEDYNHQLFSNLLAWLLVFDLFASASLKVKSGYMDHLRRRGLITDQFLPRIFNTLGLYGGLAKAVKLDIWAIDEYYLDLYSSQIPIGLPLLAAHLYYRALHLIPPLIRSWLIDCRDRQLSNTVTTYTSTHFSPIIIQAELAQVKDPEAAGDLADDTMKVKVASAVNEITAAYVVDEHELELRLRLPSDWPLHTIEVKDANRVGVSDDRWRSWVLGVQQILTFRSGSIIDGLAFFKKNAASHFEGQSECAICYSVISAMDGSLPKKPCKTCKNRFHAGCLYKWFSTSHSSSCPLCRSEIIQ